MSLYQNKGRASHCVLGVLHSEVKALGGGRKQGQVERATWQRLTVNAKMLEITAEVKPG